VSGGADPETVAIDALIERYEVLLIDAYGVLNDARGALPGAAALIAALRSRGARFMVATNDASRLPATVAARLRGFGVEVDDDQVLTSGALLGPYITERDLAGGRFLVLGTDDSRRYITDAGGEVAEPDPQARYDAIVVADDEGYDFLPGVEAALNAALSQIERGEPPALVLPNPDLIYPRGEGAFGFTSGAVALLIEAGLERRLGARAPRFDRLGKPNRPFFAEARRRAGTDSLVMIGDQLETDIAGARRVGFDAALLTTGVSRWTGGSGDRAPTYLLESLQPGR
jgi:HAD superfamily hydrolase (TIGR01450 family)